MTAYHSIPSEADTLRSSSDLITHLPSLFILQAEPPTDHCIICS